jgi:hypothetical protein
VQLVTTGDPGAEMASAFTALAIVRPVMVILAARESHFVPEQENVAAPVPSSEYVPDNMTCLQFRLPAYVPSPNSSDALACVRTSAPTNDAQGCDSVPQLGVSTPSRARITAEVGHVAGMENTLIDPAGQGESRLQPYTDDENEALVRRSTQTEPLTPRQHFSLNRRQQQRVRSGTIVSDNRAVSKGRNTDWKKGLHHPNCSTSCQSRFSHNEASEFLWHTICSIALEGASYELWFAVIFDINGATVICQATN